MAGASAPGCCRRSPAAKVRTGEAAGQAAAIAHQVHGAIGFTAEHRLHHYTAASGPGATRSGARPSGRRCSAAI